MMPYAVIETHGDPSSAVRRILAKMLSQKLVDAVFVPARSPYSPVPMPTLIAGPERIVDADPLAPVSAFNAAKQAASVIRYPTGKRVALVLRPCEIRALIELTKLNQCALEDAVIIGIECLGRFETAIALDQMGKNHRFTEDFYGDPGLQKGISGICKACEHFQPRSADITLCVLGHSIQKELGVSFENPMEDTIIDQLGIRTTQQPESREPAVRTLLQERKDCRDNLFRETGETIKTVEGFQNLIANCINCYNCRVACPVCYCKECVFVTDVFAHPPEVLQRRAIKRGAVKIPTDTSMFHLTRLAHMSHACVGCGQCSSACPNGIPVAELFRTVAFRTQTLFDYEPGFNVSEPVPYFNVEEKSSEVS